MINFVYNKYNSKYINKMILFRNRIITIFINKFKVL